MRMRTYRRLMRNPPYKHTCGCGDCRYLSELPVTREDCVDCRYWMRDGDGWVDVTDGIPRLGDGCYDD